jgi:hypothetical protein
VNAVDWTDVNLTLTITVIIINNVLWHLVRFEYNRADLPSIIVIC